MYTYTTTLGSTSLLRSDGATIPLDPANTDYQAYLAWVAAGNTPTPAPAPTAAQQWAAYQALARAALDRSDVTMARVTEAVALGLNSSTGADVVAYVNWRRGLRAIVGASSGTAQAALPAEPPFPAGT